METTVIDSMLNSSQQGYSPYTYLHPSAWTSSLLTPHFVILHFGLGTKQGDVFDKIAIKNVFVIYMILLASINSPLNLAKRCRRLLPPIYDSALTQTATSNLHIVANHPD